MRAKKYYWSRNDYTFHSHDIFLLKNACVVFKPFHRNCFVYSAGHALHVFYSSNRPKADSLLSCHYAGSVLHGS